MNKPFEHVPTAQEQEFHKMVADVVLKPEGHKRMDPLPSPEQVRLYTVTTLASSQRVGGTRTPVICTTFEKAASIVERNVGDIYEYSYLLVVIEAVAPNCVYGNFREQYWYAWIGDSTDGAYKAIEVPEAYRNILGWGIG